MVNLMDKNPKCKSIRYIKLPHDSCEYDFNSTMGQRRCFSDSSECAVYSQEDYRKQEEEQGLSQLISAEISQYRGDNPNCLQIDERPAEVQHSMNIRSGRLKMEKYCKNRSPEDDLARFAAIQQAKEEAEQEAKISDSLTDNPNCKRQNTRRVRNLQSSHPLATRSEKYCHERSSEDDLIQIERIAAERIAAEEEAERIAAEQEEADRIAAEQTTQEEVITEDTIAKTIEAQKAIKEAVALTALKPVLSGKAQTFASAANIAKGGGLLENIIIVMIGLALYLILTNPEIKVDNIIIILKENLLICFTIITAIILFIKSSN